MHSTLFRKTSSGVVRRPFLPIGHIGCTIRAYPAHAAELNNANPEDVVFFYKNGRSCAWPIMEGGVVPVPTRFQAHHEIEICLLMGETPLPSPLGDAQFNPIAVKRSIVGIGLGIDWTLRDIQQPMAKAGLPWERSKSFERSAAFTEFLELGQASENLLFAKGLADEKFPQLKFALQKNGDIVQTGNTDDISFCPLRQVWEMHKVTRLRAGDVVMTGTTTGVGPVKPGDKLELKCEGLGLDVKCAVVAEEEIERQ